MNNNLKKRKRKAKMKIAMKIMKLRVNQTAKKMILRKVRPCLVAVFYLTCLIKLNSLGCYGILKGETSVFGSS